MPRTVKSFVFFPNEKSIKVENIEEAHLIVVEKYPTAIRHGSIAAWHWRISGQGPYPDEGVIVAEAIMAAQGDDWYLRIKPMP